MLPARREKPISGILRAPKREWTRHQKFIRRHACVVTLGKIHDECDGRIECCHYRTAENSGTGLRPHDAYTFSACSKHHAEQHRVGQDAFEKRYGINLANICREFASISTVPEVRQFAREMA